MLRVLLVLSVLFMTTSGWAASNVLTWTDNSNNEANFKIERKTVPNPSPVTAPVVCTAGGYIQIATTGSNVATFTDASVSEDTTYCYQVRASNPAGDSGYTNMAGRYVPFSIPASPSGLGVAGGP